MPPPSSRAQHISSRGGAACLPLFFIALCFFITRPVPSPRKHRSPSLAARILAAAAPSAAVWAFAVHAAGIFRWGIASGLCVGLFCAALTLKSISFAQQACPAPWRASGGLAGPGHGASGTAAAGVAASMTGRVRRNEEGPRTTRSREQEGEEDVDADAGDDNDRTLALQQQEGQRRGSGGDASFAPPRSAGDDEDDDTPAPQQQQGQRRVSGGDASLAPPARPPFPSPPPGSSRGTPTPAPTPQLTFGEFAFFLLLAPSLVCEPHMLVSSARRPRRVAAAASEFFHAGLAYLAVHVTCSAFFAPILRVLAEALHPRWADGEGWEELRRSDGSGWWLHGGGGGDCVTEGGGGCGGGGGDGGGVCGEAASAALEGLGQQHGSTTVAVAGCLGMFVFTPLMHFLMFYAFFHSVCLGCAELWGYPDRNIYGE